MQVGNKELQTAIQRHNYQSFLVTSQLMVWMRTHSTALCAAIGWKLTILTSQLLTWMRIESLLPQQTHDQSISNWFCISSCFGTQSNPTAFSLETSVNHSKICGLSVGEFVWIHVRCSDFYLFYLTRKCNDIPGFSINSVLVLGLVWHIKSPWEFWSVILIQRWIIKL